MNALEARHIHKSYAKHKALNDVSIVVPENSVFGLLGPNGAGKTSLIRIINQITGPDQGEVLFGGRPLQPGDVEHIGYLPEERGHRNREDYIQFLFHQLYNQKAHVYDHVSIT